MNTKTWFEIIAKCGQPEKTTDCVIAKWREDKREGRVTRDNIEMTWAPVENPSRGQSGIRDCKPLVRFTEKN